ncbi:MAG: alpha/beta fold hydrolase [Candidatus Niyogibacteria bacterium]|nr:alpha/beta fold hydrolase [Candidatus Niyogibacteria bacterium]
MVERITLETEDGVAIVGDHYKGPQGSPAVLLLHMMPATRASWNAFAGKLNAAGFGALAIDLRGHGESQGGPDGYQDFTDGEHQASIADVRAALAFQEAEGHSKFFIVGASIGANLALQMLAESERVSAAILLSPGINYRGVETLPVIAKVRNEQGVYIVAAKDNVRAGGAAHERAARIFGALTCRKELKIFDTGGHGTDMLVAHPEFMDELADWLKNF